MDGAFHEVLFLTGILLHVEKLFAVFAFVVDDVFVTLCADHAAGDAGVIGPPGKTGFGDDVVAPCLGLFPECEGAETFAGEVSEDRKAGEIKEGGKNVESGRYKVFAVNGAGFCDASLGDDEGDAQGFVVEDLFLVPVVRGNAFAVVAGEEDESVLLVVGFAQGVEDLEDQRIDLFDEAIVAPEVLTPLAVGPLGGGIVEVAVHFLHLPDDRRFVGRVGRRCGGCRRRR